MNTQTIQRVRSHGAAIDRYAFEFADRFLDSFFAHCPELRSPQSRFRGSHESQRRLVAHQWAWFVRHLGELDRVTPELEALGTFFTARGLGEQEFRMARLATLEALRDVSGAGWTPQCEADWAEAFDACVQRLRPMHHYAFPQGEQDQTAVSIAA